jgi:hypothetical protein
MAVGFIVLIAVAVSVGPVGAQEEEAPRDGSAVRYRGPSAFLGPDDPFQSVRFTFGLTLPSRLLLNPGSKGLTRHVNYDLARRRVLVTYQATGLEILGPIAFDLETFAEVATREKLRESWVESNRRSVANSTAGSGDRGFNLTLPVAIPLTEKIFGEGAPNLRVSGSENITISGTSSWQVGQKDSERGGGSIFPKLDMRQRLNVNLQGTIGTKLFVDISQNSDALTPLENAIRIRYRGEEDEVIQSVELGNTNLSLPATQYVSFSARQEGLFGVKANAKVGSLGITAIASRQEGEPGQATLVGGNSERSTTLEDWSFIRGKYFFISDPDSAVIPRLVPNSLRVYLDDNVKQNDIELAALDADVFLDPTLAIQPDTIAGDYHQLEPERDYNVYNDQNYSLPLLVLRSPLSSEQSLAVAYQESTGTGIRNVGTIDVDPGATEITLKLIRAPEREFQGETLVQDYWAPSRRLEIKNIYRLNDRNIDRESFRLQIFRKDGVSTPEPSKRTAGGVEVSYIEILGLDQRNNETSERIPDGRIDDEYIDYTEGLIFFPDQRPFDPTIADFGGTQFRARSWPVFASETRPDTLGWEADSMRSMESLQEANPDIYDLKKSTIDREIGQYNKYQLQATYQTSVSTLNLEAVGPVLEGSETVRLNGNILQRNTDYTIYYDQGVIEFKNPEATAPGADLVVTWSYDSPFSRGSRSLVGASLAYQGDANYSYSTSWLTESRGVPERRPSLGQEPTKTTVGDLSGAVVFQPWFLTDLTDKIPFVDTNVPSQLNLQAAMGISIPDPNTRNVVYVDDMEGVELVTAAGVSRRNWFYSSPPLDYAVGSAEEPSIRPAPPATDRGKLLWFSPQTVRAEDLNPALEQFEGDNFEPTLEVIYIPGPEADPEDAWGGLVTSLSPNGVNLTNAQYIDIWLNDFHPESDSLLRNGEIRIDLGQVSEDAVWDPRVPPLPPNGKLDYEDRDFSGGLIGQDEDTGLDSLFSAAETLDPGRVGGTPQDPHGDDRRANIGTGERDDTILEKLAKFDGINGTEDNDQADGEDLNGDFRLQGDNYNNYLEYRIGLRDAAVIDVTRDYPSPQNPGAFPRDPQRNGWRLYRIPIRDPGRREVGITDLARVQHMRIWFRGIAPGDTLDLQIASIEVVGNRWEQIPVQNLAGESVEDSLAALGSSANIAVVNNKDNQAEYVAPFGLERRDRVTEREQSLSLEFENLQPGHQFRAFRTFPQPKDYTLYETLAFYVNPRLDTLAAFPDTVEFFLRFGSNATSDSLSYYELATPVSGDDLRRRADGWMDFRMGVTELSSIKIGVPPGAGAAEYVTGPFDVDTTVVSGSDTTLYRARERVGDGFLVTVRGQPSFSQIRRMSVGLRNRSGHIIGQGRVWFNEIRLGDVRRERGWIGRASVGLSLADLASFTGSASLAEEDFVRLGQSRGSGARDLSYNVGTLVNLHKFVEETGILAPLRWSTRRTKRTPKFFANSDIEFTGENTGRDVTETGATDLNFNLDRNPRGRSPFYLRHTVDAVNVNGTVAKSFNNQTAQVDTTTRRSVSVSYNLRPQVRPLRLLGRIPVNPFPTNVSMVWNGSKQERHVYSRDRDDPTILRVTNIDTTRSGSLSLATSLAPIHNLTYNFNSKRDLIDDNFRNPVVARERPPRKLFGIDVGREVTQSQGVSGNYSAGFAGDIRPRVTLSTQYAQSYAPGQTREDYSSTARAVNNSNNLSLSFNLPVGKFINNVLLPPTPQSDADQGNLELIEERKRKNREQEERLAALRARNTGAAPADSAAGDTADAPEEEPEKESEKPGKSTTVRMREFFRNVLSFGNVQTTGALSRRSSYTGIDSEPDLLYRFGLTQDVGLGSKVGRVYSQPNTSSEAVSVTNESEGRTVTFRGNTSATLFKKITLDFNIEKQMDRSSTNNTASVQDDTTWPEVRINWGDIHQGLPLVNSLFTDFRAVSSSYSKSTSKRGTPENPAESVTTNSTWRPLVRIEGTLRGEWRTRFNLDRQSGSTVTQRTGSPRSINERSSIGISTSFSKTFRREQSGGKNIDYTLDVSYSRSDQETRREGSAVVQPRRNDDFTLRNSATIRFSRTISGTLGLILGQRRDLQAGITTRSIGVTFNTGFTF